MDKQLPPQAVEAEMSILGGIFIDNEIIDTVHGALNETDFYRESHRAIFQAMARLNDRNEPIDLITTSTELKNVGKLDEVGGAAYLSVLVDFVPMSANTLYYCRIVAEKAERRRLITSAQEAITLAYGDGELADAVGKLETATAPAEERNAQFVTMRQSVKESVDRIEFRHKNRGRLTGLSYGLDDLDAKTFGMHGGELIIVAGRPSMGKSAFAGNVGKSVAMEGKTALMFTLEMPRLDVTDRTVASYGIKYQNIRSGNLQEPEWMKMKNAMGRIQSIPLFIDDSPGLTLKDVRSKARRLKKQEDLSLVIVDYLQLMQLRDPNGSRVNGLGEITRGLKLLARELNIPVMLLSQLSRKVDERPDKRPMMSDLRESGEIEQDADVILFPFRPAAYCAKCRDRVDDHEHSYDEHQSMAEIIIEKQRAGERNQSVKVVWLGEYQRFENVYSGGLPE